MDTTNGELTARRVLLALGPGEPLWPVWAQALRTLAAPIAHACDPQFVRAALPSWSHGSMLV
jgi:hypothetical protein